MNSPIGAKIVNMQARPMTGLTFRTVVFGVLLIVFLLPSVAQRPTITPFHRPAAKQVVVHGIVIGPDNKPVSRADVEIMNYGAGGRQHVLSGEDGTFSFSTLETTASLVDLRALKGSLTVLEPVHPVNLHVRIRLVKNAWTSLSGRAVDTAGHPLPGLNVQVASNVIPENIENIIRKKRPGPLALPMFIGTGKTDASGKFFFPHIVASPHVIIGISSPVSRNLTGQINFDLIGGRPAVAPDVITAPLGTYITGTVFGAHRVPTNKVVVTIKELPGQRIKVDSHGKFRVDNLQERKNYTFIATARGRSRRQVSSAGSTINLYMTEPWEELP